MAFECITPRPRVLGLRNGRQGTIEPETAGTVNGTDTAVSITWDTAFYGTAYIKVSGMNNTGVGPQSNSLTVIVIGMPTAVTPIGPEEVNTDDNPTTVYTADGSVNASSYNWQVSPPDAYSDIAMAGMDATITWSGTYTGPVTIKVRGVNNCGTGSFSDELNVTLENLFGIDELAKALGLTIYPNPNKGTFTLEIATNAVDRVNVRIVNATGHLVYTQADLNISSNFSTMIDLSKEAEGIYLMLVESDLGIYTSRIVIQK